MGILDRLFGKVTPESFARQVQAAIRTAGEGDDLTPQQAAKMMEQVRPMVNYIRRRQLRMVEQGFSPNDPLKLIVDKCYDSLHHLMVDLHYRTCKNVGRD